MKFKMLTLSTASLVAVCAAASVNAAKPVYGNWGYEFRFFTEDPGKFSDWVRDFDKLISAGDYICGVLGRPTHSRAARALRAKQHAA